MMKKLLAVLLALAMLLSIPLAVSAEGDLVIGDFLSAKSDPLEVGESLRTWTFHSKSNDSAVGNWETPSIQVMNGDTELLFGRSDAWALKGLLLSTEGVPVGTEDEVKAAWAAWLNANKSGVDCKVTAQIVKGANGNFVVAALSNNGVISTYSAPIEGELGTVNLYITGQNCTVSNLAESTTTTPLNIADYASFLKKEGELKIGAYYTRRIALARLTEEPQTWTFKSKTDGSNNWDTPAVQIRQGMTDVIYGRADAWAVTGTASSTNAPAAGDTAWGDWLNANKSGVDCKVTAQIVTGADGNKQIEATLQDGVITTTFQAPIEGDLANVWLCLSGENCTLTELAKYSETPEPPASEPATSEPTTSEPTTSEPATSEPATSEPATSEPATSEPVQPDAPLPTYPADWKVDVDAAFSVKSDPLHLTEKPQTWTFTSKSYANAVNNWETPSLDIFNGADWVATIRSDSFAVLNDETHKWGTDGIDAFGGKKFPEDWAAWVNANKAGVECKVTAQLVRGAKGNYIVVALTNNGITNTYIAPTGSDLSNVNLFLTGEKCVLTKLAASAEHININAAVASVDPIAPPATGDMLPVVALLTAMMSVCAIVVMGKKYKTV